MVAVSLAPSPLFYATDNNGSPLSGGRLYTYSAGTTSKLATYTDSTGATPNTNPVILNSRGQASVWLTVGTSYKLVLSPSTDTDPPTNSIWTQDNILQASPTVVTGGQLPATVTNDSAIAGNLGEFQSAATSSSVTVPIGSNFNCLSLSLTAGDWDVQGSIVYAPGNVAATNLQAAISTVSATFPTDNTRVLNELTSGGAVGFIQQHTVPTMVTRVSLAATTTIYLVGFCNGTGLTSATATGLIQARRAR